jgi:hypothetical protein
LADARPFAAPAPAPKDRDSDDDDENETLMDVALAAAAAPDPAKPAAKRAKSAAKLKDEYADVSETARAAARAALEKAVEAAEKTGGKLDVEDAAATATKAVFEKAPADDKALACVADAATDKESKRARFWGSTPSTPKGSISTKRTRSALKRRSRRRWSSSRRR